MTQNNQSAASDNELDFATLLKDGKYLSLPQKGDTVKGTILDVHRNEIKVDIGGIASGVIRGQELFSESDEYGGLKVGDQVEALVIEDENELGEIELSFRAAGKGRAWDVLEDMKNSKNIISVKIIDANKGGLMVRLHGVIGFLPVSQLAPEHYPRVPGGDKTKIFERLKKYVGTDFVVKVLDCNCDEDKLIVSEKSAWEETQSGIIAALKVGDIIDGEVSAVTDFGVFVEFGENLEGLVHISEIAWQRIDNPDNFVKVGDRVKAKIIHIEGSKVFLSIKALREDPWQKVEERYKIGQRVMGKVLKVNPFGLFVELDPEIHGLAHISELSEVKNADASKLVKPGETQEFTIVSIEKDNHRLGLSIKRKSGASEKDKVPSST